MSPATFRRCIGVLSAIVSALIPARAIAGEIHEGDDFPKTAQPVERMYPRPTPLWTALQLVPSPTWFVGGGQVQFALGWQITPLLVSFATHRSISPFRFFAADAWARHGGSVELYASPYLLLNEPRFVGKVGSRFYVPMEAHGEKLSFATGVSYFMAREGSHVAFDAGIYTASGLVGVEVNVVPYLEPFTCGISLRLRLL